jgi:hypothetical protein
MALTGQIGWQQIVMRGSQLAVQLRDVVRSMQDYQSDIDTLGASDTDRATALTAMATAAGFTLATTGGPTGNGDAANVVYMANVMATVSAIYEGTAAQPSDFDFDDALALFRSFT